MAVLGVSTQQESAGVQSRSATGRVVLLVCLGVTATASVAIVVLDLVTTAEQRLAIDVGHGFPSALVAVVAAGCGAWVLRHRPGHPVGWVLVVTGLLWALDGFASSWAAYAIRSEEVLPGADWGLWFYDRVGALLLLPVPLLLLLYPHGRLAPGRLGTLGKVSLTLAVTLPLALLVSPARIVSPPRHLSGQVARLDLDKLSLPLGDTLTRGLLVAAVACAVVAYLTTLTSVAIRRARAGGADRQRYDWLVWAALIDVAVFSFGLLVKDSSLTTPGLVLAIWVTAGAVSIGVLRPTALDIDRLLSATVVYGLLTAVFVGIDLGALAIGTLVLGDRLAVRDVTLVVLVVALVGYGPLREGLRRAVRRLLVGEREDRYAVVAGLASRLERTTTAEQQLAEVTAAVARTFGVGFVQMQVIGSTGELTTVTHGTAPAQVRSMPIRFRDEEVGRLVLSRVGIRARLSGRDQELLADVVRQAAVATRSHQLAEQLQESRRQLVAAREEERRRIRRDLHDGLGPALGSVVLRLDLARNVLAPVPAEADALLVQSREEVRTALVDLRRLVHGLRPPALDDLGLAGALRHEVSKVSGTIEVEVCLEELPALGAAVEVAAYRIVCEALANAVRHSSAARVRVSLSASADTLFLAISDDGTGIPHDKVAGVGLVSMRERAAELGGSLVVTCPGGGTRVEATLPLEDRS